MAQKYGLFACFLTITAFLGCTCPSNPTESDFMNLKKGTIKHIKLEGGFYAIVSDQNEHYDPINLPQEFKKDGLRVRFRMQELKDQVSIHMWGTPIKLEQIEKINTASP